MVRLRPIREEELELVMNWRMHPDITRFMYTDPVLTMEMQRKWYEESKRDEHNIHFMIEVDGIPAGVMNITEIDRRNQRCSWGYYIAVKEKRSLQLALALEWNLYDYVFHVLGLHKLEGEIFAFNKGVIRMHQMCGSVIEGVRKQHILKNGEYYDVVEMGICREEWEEIRGRHTYERIPFLTWENTGENRSGNDNPA